MSELQSLKALNKTIFTTPKGKKVKIRISDCKGEYCKLNFRYDSGDNLFPHVEPNNNICYIKPEGRFVKNLKQFNESKEKAINIVDEEYSNEKMMDEICSELINYYPAIENLKYTRFPISEIKKDSKKAFFTDKDENQFISSVMGQYKRRFFAELTRVDVKDFATERKTNFLDFLKTYIPNIRQNKMNVIEIFSKNATSYFGFLNGKIFSVTDSSVATSNNARTSNVDEKGNIAKSILSDKKILIIGVGAIGSHVAELVSSMWPKEIEIVDFDITENSSSVRQNYSRTNLAHSKVASLENRLSKFGGVKVVKVADNYKNILSKRESDWHDCDLIIDCTGEAMISSYTTITKNLLKKDGYLMAAYLTGDKPVVKVSDASLLDSDIFESDWHKTDVENDKLSNGKTIIKGCSPVLLYSYVSVYKIAAEVADKVKELYE